MIINMDMDIDTDRDKYREISDRDRGRNTDRDGDRDRDRYRGRNTDRDRDRDRGRNTDRAGTGTGPRRGTRDPEKMYVGGSDLGLKMIIFSLFCAKKVVNKNCFSGLLGTITANSVISWKN